MSGKNWTEAKKAEQKKSNEREVITTVSLKSSTYQINTLINTYRVSIFRDSDASPKYAAWADMSGERRNVLRAKVLSILYRIFSSFSISAFSSLGSTYLPFDFDDEAHTVQIASSPSKPAETDLS